MLPQRTIEKISRFIDENANEMERFLQRIVDHDSGSSDIEDVNSLGDILAAEFEHMGGKIHRYYTPIAGYVLTASFLSSSTQDESGRILLIGHRDTVFPAGTATKRPYRRDGVRCYGPGVADMKGGLVAGLFALKAILSLENSILPPIDFCISSDEEVGSATSAPVIAARSQSAIAAFSLEPARANGAVVTGRDGGDLFDITVYGKAAHAANAFQDGVSAICPLASIIQELSALSDDPAGMNVNVGVIDGGLGAIIVPDRAHAKVSSRFSSLDQQQWLREKIQEIVSHHNRDGIQVKLSPFRGFLPFQQNEQNTLMFRLVQKAGESFGITINGTTTGSPADSGITSSAGVPTICGMGPVGGGLHTDEEYIELPSLYERTKILAVSILMAAQKFPDQARSPHIKMTMPV